jgi:DNA-binding response OmpR family regulator
MGVNNLVKEPILVVVDDDLEFLDLVSTLLKNEGYDVDTANSGKEGLEKCMENFYSLIIVDIKLPDFDGVELLTRIVDTDPKVRKVIITGYPSIENVVQVLNLGADAYLVKPIKAEELLETVRKQLLERDKEFAERYFLLSGLKSEEKD